MTLLILINLRLDNCMRCLYFFGCFGIDTVKSERALFFLNYSNFASHLYTLQYYTILCCSAVFLLCRHFCEIAPLIGVDCFYCSLLIIILNSKKSEKYSPQFSSKCDRIGTD